MTAAQDAPKRSVLGEAERACLHGILDQLVVHNDLMAELLRTAEPVVVAEMVPVTQDAPAGPPADRDGVEYEAWRWRWNAEEWQRRHEELRANLVQFRTEDAEIVRRVWKLINMQAKTLPMKDLYAALTDPIPGAVEARAEIRELGERATGEIAQEVRGG